MEWCKHIVFQVGSGRPYLLDAYYDRPPYDGHVGESWKNCPICAAPRPEAPKGLAEKLAEMSTIKGDAGCGMSTVDKAKLVAQVAYEHFCELFDDFHNNKSELFNYVFLGKFEEFKDAMKRSL